MLINISDKILTIIVCIAILGFLCLLIGVPLSIFTGINKIQHKELICEGELTDLIEAGRPYSFYTVKINDINIGTAYVRSEYIEKFKIINNGGNYHFKTSVIGTEYYCGEHVYVYKTRLGMREQCFIITKTLLPKERLEKESYKDVQRLLLECQDGQFIQCQ